jgi:choline kinase
MSGAVIAAGRGERLRAASRGMPKPLVELGGQPLMIRQIEMLGKLGVRPVHVIVNCETATLMNLHHIRLPAATELMVADTANSMESLLRLGERIACERFLLSTVDAVVPVEELKEFVEKARSAMDLRGLDGALGVVRWRGDKRPLFVETAEDKTITRLGGDSGERVTAGVYLLAQRIFAHTAAARAQRLGALREFLGFLLGLGMRFAGIELRNAVDIDEAEDLELARAIVARRGSGEPA